MNFVVHEFRMLTVASCDAYITSNLCALFFLLLAIIHTMFNVQQFIEVPSFFRYLVMFVIGALQIK